MPLGKLIASVRRNKKPVKELGLAGVRTNGCFEMCLCFRGFGNRRKSEGALCNWADVSADTWGSVWGRGQSFQCKCPISTWGSTGMLSRKGASLAVGRWDRTGAAHLVSWSGLLLPTCWGAKKPWSVTKHMKCSQKTFVSESLGVLAVRTSQFLHVQ